MGLSMLAGLIGTVLYGSYCVKNDIQAITTDNSIKPTLNQKDNERKLRINFEAICKRCNVKLDKKTKNPFKESDYKLCTEYLKYQGYDNNAIKYFEKIFKEKANNKKQSNYSLHDTATPNLLFPLCFYLTVVLTRVFQLSSEKIADTNFYKNADAARSFRYRTLSDVFTFRLFC